MKKIIKKDFLLKPTPVQKMESISKELGCNIFVKRDDLLGVGFGGNKLRKLEYLLADAEQREAKLIVTSGSLQTNHGMLTSIASSKLGFPCLLFLMIEESNAKAELSGNLLLDDFIGCEVEFVDVSDIMENHQLNVEAKDELASQKLLNVMKKKIPEYCIRYGIKEEEVYLISSAGSTSVGILGYVNCVKEIAEQGSYDYIFCGNGSGGTYGGMLLGAKIYSPFSKVIGVSIEEMNPNKPQFILKLIQKAEEKIGFNKEINLKDIHILQNSVNKGYGVPDDETMKIIEKIAREEGFFLDPVYTGKIMNGAIKYIEENLKNSGKNILILHSGGVSGLYNANMIHYRNKGSSIVNRWKNDKN